MRRECSNCSIAERSNLKLGQFEKPVPASGVWLVALPHPFPWGESPTPSCLWAKTPAVVIGSVTGRYKGVGSYNCEGGGGSLKGGGFVTEEMCPQAATKLEAKLPVKNLLSEMIVMSEVALKLLKTGP